MIDRGLVSPKAESVDRSLRRAGDSVRESQHLWSCSRSWLAGSRPRPAGHPDAPRRAALSAARPERSPDGRQAHELRPGVDRAAGIAGRTSPCWCVGYTRPPPPAVASRHGHARRHTAWTTIRSATGLAGPHHLLDLAAKGSMAPALFVLVDNDRGARARGVLRDRGRARPTADGYSTSCKRTCCLLDANFWTSRAGDRTIGGSSYGYHLGCTAAGRGPRCGSGDGDVVIPRRLRHIGKSSGAPPRSHSRIYLDSAPSTGARRRRPGPAPSPPRPSGEQGRSRKPLACDRRWTQPYETIGAPAFRAARFLSPRAQPARAAYTRAQTHHATVNLNDVQKQYRQQPPR